MVTKRLWQFYWGASGTKMKGGQHMWQHFGDFWVRAMLGSEWNPSGKPHSDCHRFPLRQQRFFKAVCNSAKALRGNGSAWTKLSRPSTSHIIHHDSPVFNHSWFNEIPSTREFQAFEPFGSLWHYQTDLTCCREVPAACVAAQDAVERGEQVPLQFWDHLFNEKTWMGAWHNHINVVHIGVVMYITVSPLYTIWFICHLTI